MNYETKYKEILEMAREAYYSSETPHIAKAWLLTMFPEIAESEDEKIRKSLIRFLKSPFVHNYITDEKVAPWLDWLEKQGEKINPYSGMSFEYNDHIWGMCARDNGVDILLDKQLFKHLEQQGEQTYAEIAESEDERIRKWIITQLEDMSGSTNIDRENKIVEAIDWLEKQNKNIVDYQQNHQDVKYPNGGIVMEDFNGGEGFYKLHLDYLSKKQVEEVEEMVRTWNKESKTSDENIINCIGMCLTDANEQRFEDYGTTLKDCLSWLKKQGKQSAEPNWCHHKVDLSDCSEEYRKAYYDGWNNCNMQHLQCEAESSNKDEKMKKAIMRILYENYTDAAVIEGVEIAEIVAWLEKK